MNQQEAHAHLELYHQRHRHHHHHCHHCHHTAIISPTTPSPFHHSSRHTKSTDAVQLIINDVSRRECNTKLGWFFRWHCCVASLSSVHYSHNHQQNNVQLPKPPALGAKLLTSLWSKAKCCAGSLKSNKCFCVALFHQRSVGELIHWSLDNNALSPPPSLSQLPSPSTTTIFTKVLVILKWQSDDF